MQVNEGWVTLLTATLSRDSLHAYACMLLAARCIFLICFWTMAQAYCILRHCQPKHICTHYLRLRLSNDELECSLGSHLERPTDRGVDTLILEPLLNVRVASIHQAVLLQQGGQVRAAQQQSLMLPLSLLQESLIAGNVRKLCPISHALIPMNDAW
jgi:hypothetical protein